MQRLIEEHRSYWRKSAEAGPLTWQAIERLTALGLAELDGDLVHPLPALARFEYLPPRTIRRS